MGGTGKVAVLVTAETKQALKQLREVNKQTEETAKTSQQFSKSMSAGVKKFGIIAVAALTVVTGGFYAMLKASSYAESYTKRWQAEQTMIANEWVRRHGSVFDRITEMYVDVRKQYVGTGKSLILSLEEASIIGQMGIKPIDITMNIVDKVSRRITSIMAAAAGKTQEGSKRLIDYITLWINTYIRPILNFIKSIVDKLNEIISLIPSIGINVSYSVFNSSGGGGGGGGDDDDFEFGGGSSGGEGFGGSWDTPNTSRALGIV